MLWLIQKKFILNSLLTVLWTSSADATPAVVLSPSSPVYITDGGSLTLTCAVDQDVGLDSVRFRRFGLLVIEIINSNSACIYLKANSTDTYRYNVTCDQNRTFTMVRQGVNYSDHDTTWSCEMVSASATSRPCNGSGSLCISQNVAVFMGMPVTSVWMTNGTKLAFQEGESVVIECKTAACRPRADIYWIMDGTYIINSSGNVTSLPGQLFVTRGSLTYTGQRYDNGKRFACRAYNGFGSSQISDNLTLIIYYPPTIHYLLSPYVVIEKQTLNVTCNASSNPQPHQIFWSPRGEAYDPFRLYFNSVSRNNSGNYTCTAINTMTSTVGEQRNGSDRRQIAVDVLYPPTIFFTTNLYKVIENQTLVVTCQVISNPQADQIFWFPRGEASEPSRLYFNSVSRTNVGNYSCTARNTMTPTVGVQQTGIDTKQVAVDILYSPFVKPFYSPIRVIEGHSLEIVCNSDGNPSPQLRWSPRGEDFVNQSRLYFHSVTRNHTGTYTCTANNTMVPTSGSEKKDSASQNVFVDVLYSPFVKPFISPIIVTEGHSLEIVCNSNGNPSPLLTWNPRGEDFVNQSRLYFHSVTRNHTGTYTCTANNTMVPTSGSEKKDSASQNVFVDVLYTATITEFTAKDNIYELVENRSIQLKCRVESNPYSAISLFLGDTLKSRVQDTHELNYVGTTRCIDADKYTCSASNSLMNGTSVSVDAHIRVFCGPRLDYRQNISFEYYAGLSDNVTLRISVIAYPKPTNIMWYRREEKTWQQVSYEPSSSSGPSSSIVIKLSSAKDFGEYLVNMSNGFGSFDRIYRILAESKPSIPTEFYISERSHDSVTMKWTPGFWGGHNQYFFIEYRIVPDGKWLTTSPIPEDTNLKKQYFTVFGLQQETTYEFRMFAINKVGLSTYTYVINATTSEIIAEYKGPSAPIGPLVGGVLGAIAVAVIVVIIVVLVKRRGCSTESCAKPGGKSGNDILSSASRTDPDYSNIHQTGQREYKGPSTNKKADLELTDITEGEENNFRKFTGGNYDSLHQYANTDITTYSSLSPEYPIEGEHKIYENTKMAGRKGRTKKLLTLKKKAKRFTSKYPN